jgi:hypothetical protein
MFGDDIIEKASSYGVEDAYVKTGTLKIFGSKSVLKYLDSAVVNILSLAELNASSRK